MPLLNKKKALRTNWKYKVLEMEVLDHNKAYHRHIYGTAAAGAAAILRHKLAQLPADPAVVFAKVTAENDALFDEVFGDYLIKQLNQWYLFFGVRVPIEDEVLSVVVSYLLRSGRCRQAEKLLLFRSQQAPLTSALDTVMASYRALVDATVLFWSGKRAEAARLLRETEGIAMPPVGTAICVFDEWMTATGDESERLKERTEALVCRWPQEDLFKLVYAGVLHSLGLTRSACEVAQELRAASRNGMVLRTLQTDPLFATLLPEGE